MPRTVRIDASQTYPGEVRIAEWGGFGALANDIIASHDASVLYNDCVDNNLSTHEVRAELRSLPTLPPGAELLLDDYGNPTLTGAGDGVYQFTYAFFVDDIEQGIGNAQVTVGNSISPTTATIQYVGYAPSISGGITQLTPTTGMIQYVGYAPVVIATLEPATAMLAYFGYAPSVSINEATGQIIWRRLARNVGVFN